MVSVRVFPEVRVAFALILVSVALVVCLAILMFGQRGPAVAVTAQKSDAEERLVKATADLDKKRKEVEELKVSLNEVKDELKHTRKKLFEHRQEDKSGQDLLKARAEVERHASAQLEMVRAELGSALAEIQRLKTEGDSPKGRRPAPVAPAPAPTEPEKVTRVIRELSEAEKEKMERLEAQSQKDRSKAQELDRELKRIKLRLDTQLRVYNVTRGEHELLKDKFKALEKRLNRTLLEKDLMFRALKDLEKRSGVQAQRTELTADEIAASDLQVEKQAAVEAEAREAAAKAAAEASPSPSGTPEAQPN